jgi:iron complex transport system ATP-binding protein
MAGPGTVLTTDGLSAGYGTRRRSCPVVRIEAAAVRPGEVVAVLGANGTGKSTLLRSLSGLAAPLRGSVRLGGEPIDAMDRSERARLVAIVTSERPDPGMLRVEEVVALGRHPHTGRGGRLDENDVAAVRRAIEQTAATHLLGRRVAQLSDGERQRVMIARALAQGPRLLVLDEPTAFLDLRGRLMVHDLVARLAAEERLAVLLATHDVEHALEIAHTVWLVEGGTVRIGDVAEMRGVIDEAFGAGGRLSARRRS